MSMLPYKGFFIQAIPHQLLDNGREWTTKIHIWKFTSSRSQQFAFSSPYTSRKKEEAIKNCFNYGKHIIDNQKINNDLPNLF